ncbi:MAG: excinuclease ABC subunit C [Alphaproteobacteria bacterium CG_4_10_14_0_8_um_filter_53_9]|nr:MAG: excinuclease ABC subunit C [Alphaproteobacteria bacterium CG_4_10_14_0_8_um_filter_53_9]
MQDGIHLLKEKLKSLPKTPGVYRMLNEEGSLLYVGKAKNLKARLTNYTQPEGLSTRIRKMVFETRELVIVETPSEAEALLLEANLIKTLKPKYNILFRDDASYLSVVITSEETPRIASHRGAKRKNATYFGPYPSAGAVYQTLDLMEKAFRLRTCAESTFKNRTRPCLKYDIKRCSAPCVGKITPAAYAQSVQQAKAFLGGKRTEVTSQLQNQMENASVAEHYEEAAALRDRIRAIGAVTNASTAMSHALHDADIFALVLQGGKIAVQAFYYRAGQHAGNHTFYPKHLEEFLTSEDSIAQETSLSEAFRLFLALHYAGARTPPPLILTNTPPQDAGTLAEALSLTASKKVKIETPSRGEKKEIITQAEKNAISALTRKTAEEGGWQEQMTVFAGLLNIPEIESVECYDISNISGKYPVASLVSAGPEGLQKHRYRRFQIQSKDTPDDYAMMREVLTRRITKGLKEGGLPSVFLVDGGKGQLNVLVQVAKATGLLEVEHPPALVGIAKGEFRDKGLETLFHHTGETLEELPIPFNSPLKFMLQQVRDEAHRFAITYHRSKRGKGLTKSKLDNIPGIGAKKKKALILHFGSVAGVEGASLTQLQSIEGISAPLAQTIYDYLH